MGVHLGLSTVDVAEADDERRRRQGSMLPSSASSTAQCAAVRNFVGDTTVPPQGPKPALVSTSR